MVTVIHLEEEIFDNTLRASSEKEIEDFYSDLEDAYKKCGNHDIVIVIGDLNAKVGGEQDPLQETVGKHILGERNDRGDLWVDWCARHEQVIMNTWFQHHQRHLYTWKCPGDGVRNQIDYINKRFRNAMLSHRSNDIPEQTVEVTMFQ